MINRKRSEEDRKRWAMIWRNAQDNMPARVLHTELWVVKERGTTPVVEFITGLAKGTHMQEHDGTVLVRESVPVKYGQQSLLARLLGYTVKNRRTGKVTPSHHRVYDAHCNGAIPRCKVKRQLLLELAGPEGNRVAWEMAWKLGIDHWYKPAP